MPFEFQAAAVTQGRELGVPYSLDPHVVGFEGRLRDLLRGGLFAPSQLEAGLLFPDLAGSAALAAGRAAAGRLIGLSAAR
jgi:hypothetical protein